MTCPNPGSLEAQTKGCICAIIDNNYGRGVPHPDGPVFWITGGCPLHAPKEPNALEKALIAEEKELRKQ